MRILVQSRNSSQFLGENGWTMDEAGAKDFENSVLAIQYCIQEGMADVRIILAFDHPELNMYLEPFLARDGSGQ